MTKNEQSSMPERGTLAATNAAAANPLREAKELELKQRQERSRKEQAKLLAELWDAGFRVELVWDFVNTADKYPAAIPILLRHATLPYSKRIKEGIVRALTVNYAGPEVLHELIRQFREESESSTKFAQMGAGQRDRRSSHSGRCGNHDSAGDRSLAW